MSKMKRYFTIFFTIGLLAATGCGGGDDGGSTPDAAPTADADPMGTGTKQLFETCAGNSECASGLCYNYNTGGMLCSQSCTVDMPNDCPDGCNMMGVCKRPQ